MTWTIDDAISLFLASFDSLDNPDLAAFVKKTKAQQQAELKAFLQVERAKLATTLTALPAQQAETVTSMEQNVSDLDALIGVL